MIKFLAQHFVFVAVSLCVTIASFCAPVSAQEVKQLRFDRIGIQHGLPQESITSIFQDSQGYMWFGTQAGLCRYDGYRIKVFKTNSRDTKSLPDNYVLSTHEDQNGNLWVGTKSGLAQFDRATQKFTTYSPDPKNIGSKPSHTVEQILADQQNTLWLATDAGLMRFDLKSKQFTHYRHDPSQPESIISDTLNVIAFDRLGNLWVGTAAGLERFNRKTERFEHIKTHLANRAVEAQNNILSLSFDNADTLWIGTTGGLSYIRTTQGDRLEITGDENLKSTRVLKLLHDNQGMLWIGTIDEGLLRRDPKDGKISRFIQNESDPQSIPSNRINTLFQDKTGLLWIGTWFAGIARTELTSNGFDQSNVLLVDVNRLTGPRVKAIAEDDVGRVWIGTVDGLNLVDTKNWRISTWKNDKKNPQSLPDNQLLSLEIEANNRLLIGAKTGLTLFEVDKQKFTRIPLGADANSNYIERLLIDRERTLWVLTHNGLFRRPQGQDKFESFVNDPHNPDTIASNWGLGLLEDREGQIWIGTINGLDLFNKASKKFRHFQHNALDTKSLSHNRVHHLFQDSKGRIWVGTAGGLNLLKIDDKGNTEFQLVQDKDGNVDPVGGILEDSNEHIWFSTTAGITSYVPETNTVKHYTQKDGLIKGSYFVGASLRLQNGTLVFGGLNGFTAFRTEMIKPDSHKPPVTITDFLISNQSINSMDARQTNTFKGSIFSPEGITLSQRNSNFSIEFSALHFSDPTRNKYAYRLEGFDQKWTQTDATKRQASYTNLDPGNYLFRVKASNKDDLWNEEGAQITVTITPPFWKSWWFRILFFAGLLGVAFNLYKFRIRSFVKRQQRLENLVAARTAELKEQTKSALERKAEVVEQKESLEIAHRQISQLSEIGRQITATLDTELIIQLLYENVRQSMELSIFEVGFYNQEKNTIDYPFVIMEGERCANCVEDLRDQSRLSVWCVLNNLEVFINDIDVQLHDYRAMENVEIPLKEQGIIDLSEHGTAYQSMLIVPILLRGKVRGVIGVASVNKNSYSRPQLDILRTLAAYAGVALDNADAYQQLKGAQQQLVEKEKLAALGSLVAGVAHELNTPIGNSLMVASTLQEQAGAMQESIASGAVKRSDFNAFIKACKDASILIMRGLSTSANLIQSFKQVAVDQESAQRRPFNLKQVTDELVATMMSQVRKADHQILVSIPNDIQMDGYPGSYGQVIINLIQNALVHGFEAKEAGQILIEATQIADGNVEIIFKDNGAGVAPEILSRIFEPFFTTKLGHGGSGLGLSITYNIVTSLLEGKIKVESQLGVGTTFTLELPQVVKTA